MKKQAIRLAGVIGFALTAGAAEEFAPLFPFLISYDAPDNVTSMAHLLDAPAGKDGFIRVEDGRFVNNKGRVRLNATNLTGPANFPSHADADQVADRLARFGINCVRLHYFDAEYGNFMMEKETGLFGKGESLPAAFGADPAVTIPFSAEQVDRQDYLIAALKKRGIYVDMNLHVARFPKGFSFISSRIIASEKDYAKKLLTRVNPYTKLAYVDDPCVAVIEINNENALFAAYHWWGLGDHLAPPVAEELSQKWNQWLRSKYGNTATMLKAWKWVSSPLGAEKKVTEGKSEETAAIESGSVPVVKRDGLASPQAKKDFYQFLVSTDRDYWVGMADYVKKELKARAPVSGTQLGYSPPFVQSELDYVDNHSYWCHPSPVSAEWRIRNESMVNAMSCIRSLAGQRVLGKPYTVSEYNHPFPNEYGAEGQPMLRAYGALQGWDGVFEYTYNHTLDFKPRHNTYFFSMIARTDVLAHMPACAAIYLRGDVREATRTVAGAVDYASYFERLVASESISADIGQAGWDTRQTLVHKTGVDLTGARGTDPSTVAPLGGDQKVVVSDTGELIWNTEVPEAGYWIVKTANTKLFSGFPKGRTVDLGGVTVAVGKTRLDWATVSLVSRAATGFGEKGEAANILLAATGLSENEGTVLETSSGKSAVFRDRLVWGNGTVLAEGVPATITLPSDPAKTTCFALDPRGERKTPVPVEKVPNGSKIVIGPQYQTVWYEIAVD